MLALLALVAAFFSGVLTPASPAPSAPSKRPLRTIGRVRAITTFCKAFETHFNAAVGPLLTDDAQLGYVNYTLAEIEPHYHARAPELLLYDDRVKLIHYLGTVFAAIPQAQSEINALRTTAKSANDPPSAKLDLELASALQRALDKQHALALDSLGVVHAMVDVATGSNQTWVPKPLDDPQPAATGIGPALPGGDDPAVRTTSKDMNDVRTVLSFQKQLNRINDAESEAAEHADMLEADC